MGIGLRSNSVRLGGIYGLIWSKEKIYLLDMPARLTASVYIAVLSWLMCRHFETWASVLGTLPGLDHLGEII